MIGEVRIRHEGADAQASVGHFLDGLQWQPGDVDQASRLLDALLHQVNQIGAASNELRVWVRSNLAYRVHHAVCPRVLEGDHSLPLITPIACSIAATMLG